MAFVNLSGVLTDPIGGFDVGGILKMTHITTTGDTLSSTVTELIIPPDGTYDIDLNFGVVRFDYTTDFTQNFIAITTVNGDTTATTIPELLNAVVPPTNAQLLLFQDILADAVTAETNAAASAASAASNADDTVISFPVLNDAVINTDTSIMTDGRTLHIADRIAGRSGGATWYVVLTSTVTTNTFDIVQCSGLPLLALVLDTSGVMVDVKTFGADGTEATDSLLALQFAASFAIANRKVLTASKEDFFKVSATLDLTGVAANFNYATIKANFDGSPCVTFGNNSDVENLDLSPTVAFANDATGLGPAAPVDFVSHGAEFTGRGIFKNIATRDFKGHGQVFSAGSSNNLNQSVWWNMTASGCHRGFFMNDNTSDNLSICEGSFFAFGNSNAGFFSGTLSNFRQNVLLIRSEFNNKNLAATFGGNVIDTFIGGANRCQLEVYSEGTGGVVDYNIFADAGSSDNFNTINSLRQDKDHILGSNVTRSGTRVYQNDDDGLSPITEYNATNSNVSTLDMFLNFTRGAGLYGRILCTGAKIFLSNINKDQILGIGEDFAIVGNENIIAGKNILTSGSPTAQIKIGDLANNKLMTGTILVRAISGGQGGRRQFTESFNSFNGTVTNGGTSTSNINSASDAFATFGVSQTSTEVFLDLTYDSGNLGATYEVKWQVNFTTV